MRSSAREVLALERILPAAHLSETSMRMPDRRGPATRSLQSDALRAHPPQALGGGLSWAAPAKLDARAEGGAVVDSREAPPTCADSAVGDHDRGDSTNH